MFPIGLSADIEKAFLQFGIAPDDRDYLHFFYPSNEREIYRHSRVVFGSCSLEKTLSIPRLELKACYIGARLANSARNALDLPDMKIPFWTDYSVALGWIKEHGDWNVLNGCLKCKRYKAKPLANESCPLPEDRVSDAIAIEMTGVDLAGPLFLKNSSKVWIVLFTWT
ncbi:integrase catalytic domain-containing protein [Trichonephila inaurata madagascariensis]|uniref:Integrase catalytic domain-containing protein n=1 Tax=Trichonephila inaurata madagascariensis TaxID=2747483 RepID=A0A8X7CL26_9ARAC|nr:integrase catalytic domain-containing protein [Trichonephila inaurata madagascariensis]